ncbi:peptidase M15 [Frateuria sp. Soil773]|uniref:M15 family metallopeptidase n=1 Tax=Frateuria sp. Soil773 TaxID=1736407 RepID=UPI0006F5788C|nr:M15 family metallopeptidase [Frateuria sp. Soil773]KRE92418.1 peptidase M15 [Frateuria sp. Soil773]
MAFALIPLFVAALALAWLCCFPDARERLGARLGRIGQGFASLLHRLGRRTHRTWRNSSDSVRQGSTSLGRDIRRHRAALVAIVVLLLVPPLLVIGLRRHVMLDGFDVTLRDGGSNAELVASLLRGEQLVPPPPLPPEIFTTREVEMIRPDLGGASRAWDRLDDDFRQRLLAVFKVMKERYGYDMALLEGYRSPERQAMLSTQAKTVTNAGAYQSYHQYGLAADSAFYRDGKVVISEKDPWAMRGYRLYGEVAQAAGLVWGGRWKLMDFGHVELHKAGAGPSARRH